MKRLAIVFGLLFSMPALAMDIMDPACLDSVFNAAEATVTNYLQVQAMPGDTVLEKFPIVATPFQPGSTDNVILTFVTKMAYDQDGTPERVHKYLVRVTFDFQCAIVSQEVSELK